MNLTENKTMDLHRVALVAAITTTAIWTAKAVAIALAGGLGKSPAESPLFLLGLVACVVAGVLTAMTFAEHRAPAGRAVAAVAGLVGFSVYGAAEGAVVTALQPAHPGWVWGELNLWVLALTILAVAATRYARHGTAADRSAGPARVAAAR